MTQGPVSRPYVELVSIYYHDGIRKGWFGYSNWFMRSIWRKRYGLHKEPKYIKRGEALGIREACICRDPGCKVEIWELHKAQNLQKKP
jgi:hypothetical protein